MDGAVVNSVLDETMMTDGAVGAALVDWKSGMCLGTAGGQGLNLEVAAAGNTEVVTAKMKTMSALGLRDKIEDIPITLSGQYHLIRIGGGGRLFISLALNKANSNLAMPRHMLNAAGKKLA